MVLDAGKSSQEAYNAIEAARSEGLSVGTAAQERTDLADRIHKESLNLALSPLKTQPEGTRRVLIIEGVGICSKYMSDRLQSREVSDVEKQFELPAQDQMAVTRAWDGMASECISLDSGTRPDRVDACKRALCSGQLHAVILADASFTDLALRVLEEQLGPHLLSFVLAGGALAVTSSDSSQVLGALRRLFGVGWQKGGYYRTTWHPVAENAACVAGCFPRPVATAPYSAKAMAVCGVAEGERVFGSTPDSRTQSLVPFMAGLPVGKQTDADSAAGAVEDFDMSVAVADVGTHGGCLALFCDINMEVATALQDVEFRQAMEQKASGNAAFGNGEYEQALGLYREALGAFGARSGGAGEQREERVKLCSNAAECCLKLERWHEAAVLAADALRDDTAHAKSRLRRAKAALELGRREAAREDLEAIVKQGDSAQAKVAAGLLRPIREEMKIEREAAKRATTARAAAMLRGAGSIGNAGGYGGASARAGGGPGGLRAAMSQTPSARKFDALAPDSWANGLARKARHDWFIDCYRMRLDDDYALGGCYLHGLYGKSAGQGGSITGDFLGFCKLAVRHGVAPQDGAWSWAELLQRAGGKDEHGRAPLQCAFEKSDAKEKYGSENVFSVVTGGRSLRATAEVVFGSGTQESLEGMSPPCRALFDRAEAFEAQEDEFYAEVGGREAWEGLASDLGEVGLGNGPGCSDDDDDDFDREDFGSYGFTEEEEEELLSQGVKPWDDDAHNVLAALRGGQEY